MENEEEEFTALSIWSKMTFESHLPDELIIDTQDDDEDEDDMYLYDEPPPTYDVEARLKEINAELANQFLPDDPETRSRRVKFRENPVESQIPPETHCSASSEEEEEEEDDGYGASDDMEDTTIATVTTTEPSETENLALELEKVLAIEEATEVAPTDNKDEMTTIDLDVTTQSKVDANLEKETEPEIESLLVKESSKEITTTSDVTSPEELIVYSGNVSVPIIEEEDVTTDSDTATEVKQIEGRRLLESRPCSSPPRSEAEDYEEEEEEEETTMVMATEGKFHIVNMTNMSSSALHNVERPKTATVERLPLKEYPTVRKKQRTQSSIMLQKLKQTYTGKSTVTTGKVSSSSVQENRLRQGSNPTNEILTKSSQKFGYGLTVEQKQERERKIQELIEKRKLKEEQEMEEKREKREKGESAFREWLNQKKKINRTTFNDDNKVQHQVKSKKEENEAGGGGSEEAFRKWLRRKREEKDEERKLEELRLRQEEEIFCKKTREENEKAFKQWLLRKSRNRSRSYDGRSRVDSGQVRPQHLTTFRSSVRRAKLNTLRKTLQMIPDINQRHHL